MELVVGERMRVRGENCWLGMVSASGCQLEIVGMWYTDLRAWMHWGLCKAPDSWFPKEKSQPTPKDRLAMSAGGNLRMKTNSWFSFVSSRHFFWISGFYAQGRYNPIDLRFCGLFQYVYQCLLAYLPSMPSLIFCVWYLQDRLVQCRTIGGWWVRVSLQKPNPFSSNTIVLT